MDPIVPDLPDISVVSAPLYLVLLGLEFALVRAGRARGHFVGRDTVTSLAMGTGNVVIDLAFGFLSAGLLLFFWQFRIQTVPFEAWAFVLCFIADDFRYYWSHRLAHRSRWFWANHVVHHSSQEYNLGTALRQPWTNPFTGQELLRIPLLLLGFHPAMVVFSFGVNLFYQFWIHTEAIRKMPAWFEWLFNTPSHHRVHHGINARYLDANYAGVFMVWDRMFGTFVPEREDDPCEYGDHDPARHLQPAARGLPRVRGDRSGPGAEWAQPRRARAVRVRTAGLEPRRQPQDDDRPEGRVRPGPPARGRGSGAPLAPLSGLVARPGRPAPGSSAPSGAPMSSAAREHARRDRTGAAA